MSQHLIDGEQTTEGREEVRYGGHGHDGGIGHGSTQHDGFGGDGHGETSDDATLGALDALATALKEMSTDRELLERRLRELHQKRSEGMAWRDILSDEEPPGTMQVVSRMLACLAKASGTLRKELVDNLRREGVSIPAIAKLFGVTHQRVSNLLRRPPE